jgi:hypothetical protein
MGKFYVYIHLDQQKYKVNREDIKQVHSSQKAAHPALPPFHRIRKASRSPMTEAPSEEQDSVAL